MESLKEPTRGILSGEDGYALPSVLMLVTVLSLIITVLLLYRYVDLRLVLNDVGLVKAEFAAESGIARTLASASSRHLPSYLLAGGALMHEFPDGSKATVLTRPWGIFVHAASRAEYCGTVVTRSALVAERPLGPFGNALVFGNSMHELVISGNSSIRGDIVVSSRGVMSGHTRGKSSRVGSAVKGAIRKVPNPVVPVPDLPQLVMLAEEFKDLTGGTSGYSRSSSSIRLPALPAYAVPFSGDIPDSITHVFIDGDARIKMQIRRYDAPLTIVVRGSASVERGSRFEGLVALHALKRIQISDGVYLDNVVFVSGEKIAISAGTKLVGQCIAPAVAVGDGAVLKYPSIVLSSHLFSNPTQSITIGAGASVEGMVVLAVPDSASEELPTLAIPGSARVVGCVISTGRLTLEGFVTGSVLTRDFDFYEAPTRYLGWMHGGGIDRKALPSAFLLPPGLSGPLHLYVLDWL